MEVDLCGHATLASAHTLWSEGHLAPEQEARFYTRSGLLTAQRQGAWIELNFPSNPSQPIATPEGLAAALGQSPVAVVENSLGYLVELETAETVRDLQPDFLALGKFPVHGIIVTSRGEPPMTLSLAFLPLRLALTKTPLPARPTAALAPTGAIASAKPAF